LKIGIIRKPQAGKSTLFRLLTNHAASANGKVQMAVGRIPDSRVDVLARLHNSRKVTYATIDFWTFLAFSPAETPWISCSPCGMWMP